MVENARDRMNAGIRGLMRDYPRDDTPAYGDVPTGYMLTRNANGKVVVVPSNKYTPSTGARPDQKLTIGPNGEVVSSPHMSPALDKALEVVQGNANPVLSFGETGMADPSGASFFTPQYTDEDFSRSLALQNPLNRATTQEDIDEEARLKANLALSAREKQQQSQGSFWGGDQLLTKDRIEQMYGKPSADIPAMAKVILQQRSAPASAAPTTPTTSAPAAAPVAAPVAAPAAAPVQAAPLMTAYGMTQPNIPMNIGHPSIQQMAVPTSMRETAPPTWSAAAQTAAERAAPVASPATAAAARHISTMPSVIDMNTRPAINRGQPIDMTSGATSPGFLSRLFSGPSYQSTGDKVVGDDGKVNWGSSDSAADFVRADRASMAQQQAPSSGDNDDGKKRGGAVDGKKGKDEAIHKALEIIHHLLRGH